MGGGGGGGGVDLLFGWEISLYVCSMFGVIEYVRNTSLYLPPQVARGAYFQERDVLLSVKYFSECTYLWRCIMYYSLIV